MSRVNKCFLISSTLLSFFGGSSTSSVQEFMRMRSKDEETISNILLSGSGEPICEDKPGWGFFKEVIPMQDGDDIKNTRYKMICEPPPEQWYLFDGFFNQEDTTNPHNTVIGMIFKNHPATDEKSVEALKQFFENFILKDKKLAKSIQIQELHRGKEHFYGFTVYKRGSLAFPVIDEIIQKINKFVSKVNTEHQCPLAQAICDYRSFKKLQHEKEQEYARKMQQSHGYTPTYRNDL